MLSLIRQRSIQRIHPVEDVLLSRISRPPYGQIGQARWSLTLEPVRHCLRDEAKEVLPRCEAAGLGKPEAYSLEYVEDFFEPSTTQMVGIVRRSRKVNVGQAPRTSQRGTDWNLQ